MNNYEYYKEELDNVFRGGDSFCNFTKRYVLTGDKNCRQISCNQCRVLVLKWGQEEHKTDWRSVPINTPVLVRGYNGEWMERKFALYLPNSEYPFAVFGDNLNRENAGGIDRYKYCKLLPVDEKGI